MKSTYTEDYRALLVRLVSARKKAGITQTELATKLGKHQSFVSKVESGERRIDVIELLEIAKVLGVPVKQLVRNLG